MREPEIAKRDARKLEAQKTTPLTVDETVGA
jgi:preprotein translocase subunit SecF